MNRLEIKNWSKSKIKGHIWELLIPIIVAGFLSGLTIGQTISHEQGKMAFKGGVSVGIFFYFVQVGLAYFMVKFIKDQEHNFKDLFFFVKDYVRILIVGILQSLFIILWSLLLIVPGIIKAFGYSLVTLLLADEKYNNLGNTDLLKKSEEIMKGHKLDLFVFELSYIGWHILALFTLGLLEIWIVPYYTTAKYKFLNDIKESFENKKVE